MTPNDGASTTAPDGAPLARGDALDARGSHAHARAVRAVKLASGSAAGTDAVEIVRGLDAAAEVCERPDGGWSIARDGVTVNMAPCGHPGALRRGLEDAVIGVRMLIASRRLEALPPPDADWRALVERRLAALEAHHERRNA